MLVSIYMPTKNRLDLLKKAVDSVLKQTYSNFELVVVDDASTDGTLAYLETVVAQDSRVQFLSNKVSYGACHSRNLAIMAAKGDYVTGLDDDDEFKENHISSLLNFWILLSTHSKEKISCVYPQTIDKSDNTFSVTGKRNRVDYIDLFERNYIGNQIFAPRSHFMEAGLFDEKMPAWQDLEFFFRVLKKFGPAKLLDIPTYIFDKSPRADRISVGQKNKILLACDRMTLLHAGESVELKQLLMFQVYSSYYGFSITLKDFVLFMRKGFLLKGYLLMLSMLVKFNLRKWVNYFKLNYL